ncbi:glutathione peroxidase [Salibaculum sp.]|uniref:glutathione peroxidase n=1 Tax=Salibaculum sp. TaxID=2855480 RepID=UPI002B481341|nr:glutathione peroxidase [Salibaculum sp.]HKL70655.1 glutathione peroxidase [Salibaculum sp.]
MPERILAIATVLLALVAPALSAEPDRMVFDSIDGGTLRLDGPALVTNTASLCGFTRQFDDLQALHEGYADDGLTVLAVPSEDFRQELDSEDAVKAFCEVNFDLTLPMTVITPVRGAEAHPFYRWLAQEHGIAPRWNFHKVLIGPAGEVLGQWGSPVRPTSPAITAAIETALGD